MATPIGSTSNGDLWHLSIDDLLAPLPAAPRLGGAGPFVINLTTSTAPLTPAKDFCVEPSTHLYQVQRSEDHRTRFRLRLGPFATEDEADAALVKVRNIYPGALTATAETDDLRAILAWQAKRDALRIAAERAQEQARVLEAQMTRSAAAPAVKPTPPPAPIPSATPRAATVAPMSAISPALTARVASVTVKHAPAAPRPANALPAAQAAPALKSALAPGAIAPASAASGAAAEHRDDLPALEAPVIPVLTTAVATRKELKAIAASSIAPSSIAPASATPARPAPALSPSAPKAAPLSPAVAPVSRVTMAPAPPAPAPSSSSSVMSIRSDGAASGSPLVAAEIAEPPRTASAPQPAPVAARAAPGRVANFETTQTIRPLTTVEVENEDAPRWYVIQLSLSDTAFDPETLPNLDIFSEYRLYSVVGFDQGRVIHALRLGFFSAEVAASAVAAYLGGYYEKPTVKRVSTAERERFAATRLEARKDIGATGKHAVIEITNERVVRERRETSAAGTPASKSAQSALRPVKK